MAGKCNLLKPVDCTTGTFFMFSQYAQDLTRQYTQSDAYRCIPSRFAALDLNVKDYTDKQLGQIFQNFFENACTCMRTMRTDTPEDTLALVWKTLQQYDLITIDTSSINPTCDNLKYIGDINIYSYSQSPTTDGVGYDEIYCYIPNSAQSTNYILHNVHFPQDAQDPLVYNIPSDIDHISGYTPQSPTDTYTGCHWYLEDPSSMGDLKYYEERDERCYVAQGYVPDVLVGQETETTIRPDSSFDFNAILVFYDIETKGENPRVEHSNIPLGIFFTGKPADGNTSSEGKLTNTVTKFVNNEDIYNQGTSYGLRICSRFLCTPNLSEFKDVEVWTSDNNEELTQVMSLIADNANLFADISKEINDMNNGLTTHMACFRNNKVNVPYLRLVNGAWYWFVNGKNTGVSANAVDQQSINNILIRLDEISTNIYNTVQETVDQIWQEGGLDIGPIPDADIDEIVADFESILTQ